MGGVSKDKKLMDLHVNGDEELNKKEITRVDGSDNGLIGVSSNRSGPEVKIGVGFKDKDEEFKSSWANTLDKTFNSGKGFNLSDNGKSMSDGENEKDFFAELEARKEKREGRKLKNLGHFWSCKTTSSLHVKEGRGIRR
ncbi:hypothetical protein V6N13_033102 [Hibiscus sabdariffa]